MTEETINPSGVAGLVSDSAALGPERRYLEATRLYGDALARLSRGYEADPARRQDLLQDIHVALWRSFKLFDDRCSLRTWVYRVAHNTATKHILANRRVRLHEMHTLDEMPEPADQHDGLAVSDQAEALQRLFQLIELLKPMDRQVILLYLEDFSAEAIGEVVGLSPENIATKIHRIKKLLASMFHARGQS
ncbi:MAG: sigma-70 family RNA polymerase sigma factor [Steroidobacteraceae bacterium]